MERLTEEKLREMEDRCASATPGPWQQNGSHIYGPDPARLLIAQINYIGRGYQEEDAANEALVREARTDLPACLAEIRALQQEVGELREQLRIAEEKLAYVCASLNPQDEAEGSTWP